ncbi:TlpA disulfide reductase family protein [Ideonella sp. A 288]|uniref:TlpA family protein disulfide reductase n=1 Tax=Ideonella sp. A 288 TaxID=1962181 RepID=UPI000B4BE7A4|nr:TlpA disulfide reductase family protein [Ideonella sp. A 288]
MSSRPAARPTVGATPRPADPGRRRVVAGTALASMGLLGTRPARAAAQRKPWPRGVATPGLALPGVDRPAWTLASAKGKVVLINFWASWCEPCRAEMPSLELLAERHERQGLVVVAVNFKEGESTIRRFTEQTSLTLPILRDADGDAARAWGARMFPTTVAVGRDGRAVFTVLGEIDWGAEPARQWVAELL